MRTRGRRRGARPARRITAWREAVLLGAAIAAALLPLDLLWPRHLAATLLLRLALCATILLTWWRLGRRESERRRATSERLALVGRLASGIGHEINNPLSAVKGNVSCALEELERLDAAPAAREALSEALAATERIALPFVVLGSLINFCDCLLAGGLNVIDVGICPSPLVYFSLFNLPVDGGIMITGSHNAAEYNGFKICVGKEAIHGEAIQELRRVMEAGKFTSGQGTLSEHPIIPDYLAYIKKSFSGVNAKRLHVIIDCGNGAAGLVAQPDGSSGPTAARCFSTKSAT